MTTAVRPISQIEKAETAGGRVGWRRLLALGGIVLAAAVAAAFFGINDYSTATTTVVAAAQRNSQRFEAVYVDSAETKLNALRLGVDLIVANRDLSGAFARDDRATLSRMATDLFNETLKPKYGTSQFNFWTPPATLYLRSTDPKEFGTDGSTARRSIVQSNERRAPVAGMETGLGGRLGIRAMAPILDGTRLVGVVELGDDLVALLKRARTATGVEFAAGLDRKRSDEVERIPNKATDAVQGSDVFFEYSSDGTARLAKMVGFNPRDPAGQLVQADDRSVFIRAFVINNFAGSPTVVVATLFDLTQPFLDARQSASIKAAILFLVLSTVAVLGLLQFQKLQEGLSRVVFGERRKLQETTQALQAARERLKGIDAAKLGYFTNLVAAVTEPLNAVSGQLSSVLPEIEAGLRSARTDGGVPAPELLDRLHFSLAEIGHLNQLVVDFRQIELFRQTLAPSTNETVRLADVLPAVLDNELARYRRLPDLAITLHVPPGLPAVRVSEEHMRWAVTGLAGYAAQKGGHGTIDLTGAVDEAGWVTLALTGSAFAAAGAPTEALIDDTRHFISRLAGTVHRSDENGIMIALVLARTIIEKAGGRLEVASPTAGRPGFLLRLPAAL